MKKRLSFTFEEESLGRRKRNFKQMRMLELAMSSEVVDYRDSFGRLCFQFCHGFGFGLFRMMIENGSSDWPFT